MTKDCTTSFLHSLRTRKTSLRTLGLAFACLACVPCFGKISCPGKIEYLGISPSGLVQVSNGYGVWYLCSLSASYNGYAMEGCKGAYAALLTARATERTVTFYFDVPSGTSCSSFGSWVAPSPAPYHIHILAD
jgi:hypothetical protein